MFWWQIKNYLISVYEAKNLFAFFCSLVCAYYEMAKEICCKQAKIRFFGIQRRPKLARIVSRRLATSLALMTYLAISAGECVTFISLLHNIFASEIHILVANIAGQRWLQWSYMSSLTSNEYWRLIRFRRQGYRQYTMSWAFEDHNNSPVIPWRFKCSKLVSFLIYFLVR